MSIIIFPIKEKVSHKEQSEYCVEQLRKLCREEYGFEFEDGDILKNEHGKPYFSKGDLFFNISHSKGMGAIVLEKTECGIDIEQLREINYKVSERFFSEEEKNWVAEVKEESRERFFKVWTGKEAYTKYLGCGLTVDLSSFSVLDENISSGLEYIKKEDYIICVCR